MGLFGGGGSSSTNVTNSLETTVNSADYRTAEEDAIIEGNISLNTTGSSGNTFSVTSTDLGTVDKSFDLAQRAFDFGEEGIKAISEETKVSNATLLSGVEKSINLASETNKSDSAAAFDATLKYGVIGLTIVATMFVLYKKGK